ATAGGSLTYTAYTDSSCTKVAKGAGTVTVSGGKAPASEEITLEPGTYYWQASYSGDEKNNAAKSVCGSEVETVEGEIAQACTKVLGVGHWGPIGPAGGNLD